MTNNKCLTKYNPNKIVMIYIKDFQESGLYVYRKEIKVFGIIFRKAGVYSQWVSMEAPLTEEEMNEHNIMLGDNNVVYRKPFVRICYEGDIAEIQYFDNYDKAKEFYDWFNMYHTSIVFRGDK